MTTKPYTSICSAEVRWFYMGMVWRFKSTLNLSLYVFGCLRKLVKLDHFPKVKREHQKKNIETTTYFRFAVLVLLLLGFQAKKKRCRGTPVPVDLS